MKNNRFFGPNPGRWPWAEALLVEKFAELRKVGIPVDGPYLQAKMLQLVPETPGADPVKVKKFKLIKDEFTIENGMLTPTLKLKRKKILEKYKEDLEKLY